VGRGGLHRVDAGPVDIEELFMTKDEALRYVLAALEWNLPVIEDYGDKEQLNRQRKAITANKQALEQPVQEPLTVKLKDDWRTDDFGRPIIYDTDEVDEVTHALTGDEGEEDSLTVLNRMVRYVSNVWPGKTALQVLIECEEAMIATPPAAAPVQEPVAIADGTFNHNCPIGTPLYTTPQRQWVELTDEQIIGMYNEPRSDAEMIAFGREVEAKLKEKNT
jgi:hypothetical protein